MIVSGSTVHSICQPLLTHEVGDGMTRPACSAHAASDQTITYALIIIAILQITLQLRTHRALKGQLISNSLARSQLPAVFNYPIIRWREVRVDNAKGRVAVHRNNNTIKHGNRELFLGIIPDR